MTELISFDMAITPNKSAFSSKRQSSRQHCIWGTFLWGQLFHVPVSYWKNHPVKTSRSHRSVINTWWICHWLMNQLCLFKDFFTVKPLVFQGNTKDFGLHKRCFSTGHISPHFFVDKLLFAFFFSSTSLTTLTVRSVTSQAHFLLAQWLQK